MERELEKTLLEIESSIKDHERRGNTHTQSVLEQARDIMGMCAQAARAPSDLKEILERATTGGWIPVEERLPAVDEDAEETIEDDDCPEYIVTIRGASESTTLKYSPDGTWFDENGYVYDVIAWSPLPGPYRPANKPDWRDGMLKKFDRRE